MIGLHFFSPANVMKLLEIVRGAKTSDAVTATAMKLAKTIGKIGVLVGVGPGFVGNRMLALRQREAEKLILEGAMPWDVDRVVVEFGMPMGPFQMHDLAGLDIGLVKSPNDAPTVRDELLLKLGRLGQKTGGGYYDYDAARKPTPSPLVEKLIREAVAKTGKAPRAISDQEILERTLYSMINGGAQILEEKKAQRARSMWCGSMAMAFPFIVGGRCIMPIKSGWGEFWSAFAPMANTIPTGSLRRCWRSWPRRMPLCRHQGIG